MFNRQHSLYPYQEKLNNSSEKGHIAQISGVCKYSTYVAMISKTPNSYAVNIFFNIIKSGSQYQFLVQ